MKTKTLLSVVLCLFSGAALPAAVPSGDRQVSVRGFSYEVPVSNLWLQVSGRGPERLSFDVRPYEPGTVRRVRVRDGVLRFVTPMPSSEAVPGGPSWRPVASVQLPEKGDDFLLAFVPNTPGAGMEPWRVMVIENNVASYPAGSIRVLNFSPFPVAFEMGKEHAMLKPGERLVSSPELDQKYRTYVKVAAQTQSSGWAVFHQGVASVPPGRRTTLIVAYSASYLSAIDARDEIENPAVRRAQMLVIPWSDQSML